MFPNRRHIHLTGGTTFPENIFKTFYSILIITRLLCIFLFFCLIFNGWDDKRVKAYSVNNLEIKWENLFTWKHHIWKYIQLGNIAINLEVSTWTWKHPDSLENILIHLKTSSLLGKISISNKPIFSSSQCSFQCHFDC